jgi:hypothetical protein
MILLMQTFKLLFISLALSLSTLSWAIEFDHYHTVAEINDYMKAQSLAYPQVATYKKLGMSPLNREIGYVIVTNGSPLNKEALYLNGTHHGDEKSSTEAVLGLIEYFTTQAKTPAVAAYLDQYALYFQPLVNPDGHAANTRVTSKGVDPNRDYSYPERKDEDSFKQPEIKLVKTLVDQVKFRAAIAYHSGIVEILWPWCYTATPGLDNDLLANVTKQMAQATGVTRFMRSNLDYATTGEFIDYLYWKHGTIALTVELSRIKTPPIADIPAIIQTSIKGVISMMDSLDHQNKGMLMMGPVNELEGMTGTGRTANRLE